MLASARCRRTRPDGDVDLVGSEPRLRGEAQDVERVVRVDDGVGQRPGVPADGQRAWGEQRQAKAVCRGVGKGSVQGGARVSMTFG